MQAKVNIKTAQRQEKVGNTFSPFNDENFPGPLYVNKIECSSEEALEVATKKHVAMQRTFARARTYDRQQSEVLGFGAASRWDFLTWKTVYIKEVPGKNFPVTVATMVERTKSSW